MKFMYDIAEVQYMLFVMIVPLFYLICGFIFGAGSSEDE